MIVDNSGAIFDDRRKNKTKGKNILDEEGNVVKDRRKSKEQVKKRK